MYPVHIILLEAALNIERNLKATRNPHCHSVALRSEKQKSAYRFGHRDILTRREAWYRLAIGTAAVVLLALTSLTVGPLRADASIQRPATSTASISTGPQPGVGGCFGSR